ncbi:MAG: hypothetical protein V1932_06725, partial [Chloroflexota bacterium]
ACKELLEQKTKLEREVPALEKRVESLITQRKQTNVEYDQVKNATAKAGQELVRIRNEYTLADKKLETLNKKTEKEKQRIEKEVEECYRQANVTKEEVITASQVKAEVESHGFTLELMLGLSKEFAGHKNARKKLAEGLKEHGSLKKYLDNLYDEATKERARVMAEIADLESQKKGLADESIRLGNVLSQLQADVAGEDELRRFYRRYVGLSGLMDQLAAWEQVYFMRCGNPVNMTAGVFDKKYGNPHFWTDKPPIACPHCGYQRLYFDKKIYQYLNWPAERPLKITLGE